MQTTNETIARILLPAVIGAGCMIAALSAVKAIASMTYVAPNIGDIVSFAPSIEQTFEDGTRLTVRRTDQSGCVLDLATIRKSGGSLVIESQLMDAVGHFRTHWAGEHTAMGSDNCGHDTDLILGGRELDLLALSAGGYGVDQKRLPVFVNTNGV